MELAVLIENTKDSGGNRVISLLIQNFKKDKNNLITVLVVARKIKNIKDILGQIRDYFLSYIKYKSSNCSVMPQFKPINVNNYQKIISTSRRTLDYVSEYDNPKHFHLLQHIEAWKTLNSDFFLNFCIRNRYPNPADLIALVRKNKNYEDINYLNNLSRIKNIITVSEYLKKCILNINSLATIKVVEPKPHIKKINTYNLKKEKKIYDVLMFLRGTRFKGDEMVISLSKKLSLKYKILLVVDDKMKKKASLLSKNNTNLKILFSPANNILADAYGNSKIIIHPSLCEGFGSVPQEGLLFGCNVISSNVGWINTSFKVNNKLFVINSHNVKKYIEKIKLILGI
jgi:hypothetical protein